MGHYSDSELVGVALASMKATGVRIVNQLDPSSDEDERLLDVALDELENFIHANHVTYGPLYEAPHQAIMDAITLGGFVACPTAQTAKDLFAIFNIHGETYASGLYAEMYLDGHLVGENT